MEERLSVGELMLRGLLSLVPTGAVVAVAWLLYPKLLPDYGWTAFVAIPVLQGLFVALIMGWRRTYLTSQVFAAGFWGLLFCVAGLFAAAVEGLVCIVMAFPILWAASAAGTALGCVIISAIRPRIDRTLMSIGAIAPFVLVTSANLSHGWDERVAMTEVVIDAPIEQVWPKCLEIESLEAPTEVLFRAGIAYPQSIVLEGEGIGARRRCNLSTGTMPEVVDEWKPPTSFGFRVLSTPATKREVSVICQAEPAHLTGYFECLRGRFELTPLTKGRTLVRGTSWYRHRLGPAWYWSLWTDKVVHDTHGRVFREIARRCGGAR